ncbi:hypothetical protein V8E55_011437 [Tylopilus felleus]
MSRLIGPEPCDFCRDMRIACNFRDNIIVEEPVEEAIEYLQQPRFTEADMERQPISIFQSAAYHTPDSTLRAEDCATVVIPGSIVNEYRGCDAHTDTSEVKQIPQGQSASSSTANRTAVPKIKVSCPAAPCLWFCEGRVPKICGVAISCEDVPTHFKLHGIKTISEEKEVPCIWENCFANIVRKNFVRHIRECHLGHVRDKGHSG